MGGLSGDMWWLRPNPGADARADANPGANDGTNTSAESGTDDYFVADRRANGIGDVRRRYDMVCAGYRIS